MSVIRNALWIGLVVGATAVATAQAIPRGKPVGVHATASGIMGAGVAVRLELAADGY